MGGKSAAITVRILGDPSDANKAAGEVEGRFSKMGDALGKIGLVVGTAAGAALTKGFVDTLSADKITAGLQGALGTTAEDAARLGDVAASVYRDAWGDSLAEVAGAVEAVTKQFGDDVSYDWIEGATVKAQALADTFGIEVVDAVGKVGVLVSSGLVADADAGFDLLTRTLQKVPTALQGEILDATEEYSQFFQAVGLDGSQAMALLVRGAEDGQYGIDKFGDSIKEFTIRATDLSASTSSAYDAIGLNMTDMTNALLAGGPAAEEAFGKIVSGLQGIQDPGEQAAAAIAFFGTPLEDIGTQDIPAFLASLTDTSAGLGDVAGAAQELADTVGGSTADKLEAFKRKALGALADFVAEHVMPRFEQLVAWLETNWPRIEEIARDTFQRLAGYWEQYGQPALDAVIEGGRMVVDWVVENWPAISETISDVMRVVGDVLQAAIDWVVENWPAISETISDVLATIVEVVTGFVDVVTVIWQTWGEQIVAYVTNWFETVRGIIDGVLQVIRGIVQTVTALIHGDWSAAWDGIRQVFEGVWTAISAFVSGTIEQIRIILEAAMIAIRLAWDAAWAGISAAVGAIWDGIKALVQLAIDGVKAGIEATLGVIRAIWDGAWGGIRDAVSAVWETIKTNVSGAVDAVVGFVTAIPERIGDTASTAFNALWDGFKWVRDQITGGVDWIVAWVGGLPGRIAGAVIGAFSSLYSSFISAVNSIIRAWNGLSLTLGGGSYDPLGEFGPTITVPSFTISTPDIPELHTGGIVPGVLGTEQLAVLRAGEEVRSQTDRNYGGRLGGREGDTVILMIGEEEFVARVLIKREDEVAAVASAGRRI